MDAQLTQSRTTNTKEGERRHGAQRDGTLDDRREAQDDTLIGDVINDSFADPTRTNTIIYNEEYSRSNNISRHEYINECERNRRLEETSDEPRHRSSPIATTSHRDQQPTQATAEQNTKRTETTEDAFLRMTEAMTNMFQQFTQRDKATKKWANTPRSIPYQYSGLDHEDPEWFIKKMEQYFEDADIEEDLEKIAIMGERLRGRAKQWFDANVHLTTHYVELLVLFMERFNSPEEVANVLARLYGEKQTAHESVATFISRKRRMFDRLSPESPFTVSSKIIINQLEPEIRSRLRGHQFLCFEELIRVATKIETDLEEIKRMTSRQRSSPMVPTMTVVRSDPQQQVSNTPLPLSGQQESRTQPSYPCRYCRAWHFHSECPVNPYRSGNLTRVERDRNQPSAQNNAGSSSATTSRTNAQNNSNTNTTNTRSNPVRPA